jgi:hypothetical protein
MTDERDQWISLRAYALWEEAGRPDDLSYHHWCQAACERDQWEATHASSDGSEILTLNAELAKVRPTIRKRARAA